MEDTLTGRLRAEDDPVKESTYLDRRVCLMKNGKKHVWMGDLKH